MRIAALLPIVGALSLSCPALAAETAAPEMIDGKVIHKDALPAVWAGDATRGPLTHRATGTVFPHGVEGYKRDRIRSIGEDGSDVFATYFADNNEDRVSIYLFRPATLPEHRLKGAIESFASASPQAFVWSDGPFDVGGARKLRLFKATYKTGIGPDTVMDYLYFGELGTWTVKVRGTLKGPKDDAQEQKIDAIVRGLPWVTILQANGACSGTACDAARPMAYDHHVGEMFLSRILQSGQGAKIGGGPGSAILTRKASGQEWNVAPLDPVMAELFNKGFGALSVSAPIYTLSVKQGGKSQIVRFFSGTPDEALFNREVDGLVRKPEASAFVTAADAAGYAPF